MDTEITGITKSTYIHIFLGQCLIIILYDSNLGNNFIQVVSLGTVSIIEVVTLISYDNLYYLKASIMFLCLLALTEVYKYSVMTLNNGKMVCTQVLLL